MVAVMREDSSDMRQQLERVSAGDQAALAAIFEQYRPRLGQMVQLRLDRRLQGRLDPSDVLQDAFVEVSRRGAEEILHAPLVA